MKTYIRLILGLFMVLIVAGCQGCRGGAQQERGVGANKDSIVQQLDVDDMAADSMVQIRRMMPLVEAQKQKLLAQVVLADTLADSSKLVSIRIVVPQKYLCIFDVYFKEYVENYILICDSVAHLTDGMYVGYNRMGKVSYEEGQEYMIAKCTFLPKNEFSIRAEYRLSQGNCNKPEAYEYMMWCTMRYHVNDTGKIRLLQMQKGTQGKADQYRRFDAFWMQRIEEVKRVPISDEALFDKWYAATKESDGYVSEMFSDDVARLYLRNPRAFLQWAYLHPHAETMFSFLAFSNYIDPKTRVEADINRIKDAKVQSALQKIILPYYERMG